MAFEKENRIFKEMIIEQLSPLIDNDYVLWDLPFHNNIGDILIWEGEKDFLKNIKYNCIDYSSAKTCTFPKLSPEIVILLHGGGNFGDIWRLHQEFRNEVIKRYPENKIIILPQTVFYSDTTIAIKDSQIMGEHNQLTICARDNKSYQILEKYFKNNLMLLPDMAYCINTNKLFDLLCNRSIPKNRLMVLRTDKEAADVNKGIFSDFDIHDWPSIENKYLFMMILNFSIKLSQYLNLKLLKKLINVYADKIVRTRLIKLGVNFLIQYKEIYTTRLHVLILSMLLNKHEVKFLDNNYGKIYSFYQTWLFNVSEIKYINHP